MLPAACFSLVSSVSGVVCNCALAVLFPDLLPVWILVLCDPLHLWEFHLLLFCLLFTSVSFGGDFDKACGVCLAGLSFRSGVSKLGFDICVVIAGTSGAVNFDVDSLSLFSNAYFNFRVFFRMGWNAVFQFFQVFC